jgi:hypothetical protein
MPTNNLEDFSLWLAALAPLPESEKIAVLKGTSTKERFQICIRGLQQYILQIQNRTSPSSASARASRSVEAVLSTMSNGASTATTTIGNLLSALLGGATVVEETTETNSGNEQSGGGNTSPGTRRNFLVVTEEMVIPSPSSTSSTSSNAASSEPATSDGNQNRSNNANSSSSFSVPVSDLVPVTSENINRSAESTEMFNDTSESLTDYKN